MDIDLEGKKALIFGVANEKSLAWAIAKKLQKAGATIAITYQERNKDHVLPLQKDVENGLCIECDVTNDEHIEQCFSIINEKWKQFDILVHSMAFTKKENLSGKFFNVSKEGYTLTHTVSAFSLIALAKYAYPLLNEEGSIITLTTLMSERVFPNYNVMATAKASLNSSIIYLANDMGDKKIRVNGISAGPIPTGAASAIGDFNEIINAYRKKSPLKRDIDQDDVANAALFLSSDLAKNITGHLLLVDAGYHMMGF